MTDKAGVQDKVIRRGKERELLGLVVLLLFDLLATPIKI